MKTEKLILSSIPEGWSSERANQFRTAISTIHNKREYPSVKRILKELKKRRKSLDKKECKYRQDIFRELKIEMKYPQ